MKHYTKSNVCFTVLFLVVMIPLSYLLIEDVLSYVLPPVASREPLSKTDILPISTNREFDGAMAYADQVTVLMYHQIIPEDQLVKHHFTDENVLIDSIVTLEQFTEQMKYLKANNYTVLTLKEFELFMTNQKKVPANSVLITFDDGYKNVFEFAYPVLKKYGFHAVHFLITGLITDRTFSYITTELQYASIDELIETSDVFDYGNHTHSYHRKTDTGVAYLKAIDPEKVKVDIATANYWLGHSTAFAAPFGEYNPATLEILRELEVIMAFTVEPGYAEPSQHLLEIPRQGIYPAYTLKDFEYILDQHNE